MKFKTVFFDFDSTLVTIEGINELARLKGQYEAVAAMTSAAMDGRVPFASVFSRRLQLIKPTLEDLSIVAAAYCANITPGAIELIRELNLQGITCHIITAGYLQAVLPAAKTLGFSPANIHAIELMPDDAGSYTLVKTNHLLVNHDGKKQLLLQLTPQHLTAFIGDSHTDAQTIPVVDRFIGFAGVSRSDRLQKYTSYHSTDPSLLSVLPYIN